MLKKVWQNAFFQGSILITITTFLVSFLNYVFNLLIARGVTLETYGEYFSSLSYATLLTIPFGAFGTILIKKIGALDPEKRHEYAHSIEYWLYEKMLKLSPVILLAGAAIYFLLGESANLQSASILFILALTLFSLMQTFYSATFHGFQAFFLFGVLMVSGSLLKVLGGIAITLLRSELIFLYLVISLTALFQLIVGHFLIKHKSTKSRQQLRFPKLHTYFLRKEVLIPLITTLGFVGIANMDIILVKKFLSGSDAGLYSALTLLSKIIFFLAAPIASVGYIFFTGKEHKHKADLLLLTISGLISLFGLAAIVFYHLFSEFVIHFFFDQRYDSLQGILWLGGVYGLLYSLILLYSQYFMAKNSIISTFTFATLLLQMALLTFSHQSLTQVMTINVGVMTVLLAAYFLSFCYYFYQNRTTHESSTSQ